MSEDLFKYVPNLPDLNRSKDGTRKIPYVEKEILNLTGGLFPARLINAPSDLLKANDPGKLHKWIEAPIVQQNKKLGQIYCWQKQEQQTKIYSGQKFNVRPEVMKFSKQEYQELGSDLNWSYQQTVYLFDLMESYNLNFIVVHDRYNYGGKPRTIEELKEHYYKINNKLLNAREIIDHPLHSYKYDAEYQMTRKFQLEKYLLRNKETNDLEKKIIEEIRRLEIVIRKEEREQISLKKALKLEQVVDEPVENDVSQLIDNNNQDKNDVPVYTRQQYLQKPLPLPQKLNAKMLDVLQGLNIPQRIIANQENEELYDELRKQILLMFSAQRYLKKKQNQKRTLQEKRKKMVVKEDDGNQKKFVSDAMIKKKAAR